jgi:hypothetical protein
MKNNRTLLALVVAAGFLLSCNYTVGKTGNIEKKAEHINNPIIGKWVRIGQMGPIGLEFKENGLVAIDFGNDQTIDVTSKYEISNDTIRFIDTDGKMCEEKGVYKVFQNEYYISFDLLDDNCNGRIKSTMGFWTSPNFQDYLDELDKEISDTEKPILYLNRARIYIAIGKPKQAKTDLDNYLLHDTTDARAYINRAGTRFPDDMQGVLADCNKAIELQANDKNAYFLRGLALYELGEDEKACENFSKAIELGFSILRIAEEQRCAEFWDKKNNN